MAQVAKVEGRFSEAETLLGKVLEINPKLVGAWSLLANLRKMTPADRDWLRSATELAANDVTPIEEADLRFAIGKYYDDVGEFDKAFQNFDAANALVKSFATKYDRRGRDEFIDKVVRASSKEFVAAIVSVPRPRSSPCSYWGCRAPAPRSRSRYSLRIP